METYQRQLVLLIGFMTLLTVVILFAFVYAPNPADPPGTGPVLPGPLQKGINATVQGWDALFQDLNSTRGGLYN